MPGTDPTARFHVLEATEAIKTLKHRYLRSCGRKNPDTFRDCFIATGAVPTSSNKPARP